MDMCVINNVFRISIEAENMIKVLVVLVGQSLSRTSFMDTFSFVGDDIYLSCFRKGRFVLNEHRFLSLFFLEIEGGVAIIMYGYGEVQKG